MVDHINDEEGPSFVIGNIARGIDMWDRDAEIDEIWKTLKNDNVLLKACRRFGKSSIMLKMKENPRHDFICFMFDAESTKSPEDFVVTLLDKLRAENELNGDANLKKLLKKAIRIIKKSFNAIDQVGISEFSLKFRDAISSDWRKVAVELIDYLSGFNRKILFIIDELPQLILNMKQHHDNNVACEFLNWFREVRQSHNLSNIRWLFGGSIGIEHAIKKVGAQNTVINDLSIIVLKPYSDKIGREFIAALLKQEGKFREISSGIIEKIMNTVGSPVPYFLQILIKESLDTMNAAGEATLTNEIIEDAYHESVLGVAKRAYFEHFYDRLSDYYDNNEVEIVKQIIVETARKEGGISKADLSDLYKTIVGDKIPGTRINDIMADLQNEFYIVYDHTIGTYRFLTNVLRDWWLRYHSD
ncbi:MAG: hypothetical protein HQK99_03705 [Nitrospirae bacterium]|nr:hypothetical protein [Nitrospirota bacterium]